MAHIRKVVLFAMGLALVAGLIGTSGAANAQDAASFPVNIRFLNAVTSLESVDVYVNGSDDSQRVVEGLAYGAVSDTFTGTAPATNVLVKMNVNLGFDRYLFNTIVPTEAGKEYLVVISDLILIPTEFDTSALDADQARARIINAAPQAPALDIYATAADAATPSASMEPIVSGLSFANVTDGGTLPAGSYDVKATAAGTDTVAVELTPVAFDAGNSYVSVIIGKPGDTDTPLTIVNVSAPTAAAAA